MKFVADNTIAVIRSYPDGMTALSLTAWLNWIGIPFERIHAHWKDDRDMSCAYNFGVKHLALKYATDQIIFADADIRPDPQKTAPFLEIEADVVSCTYTTDASHGEAWPTIMAFHTGLWRTHRTVLEAIEPPWFHWKYKDDGCDLAACLCESFAEKVVAKGFTIAHGGWAGHTPRRIRATK